MRFGFGSYWPDCKMAISEKSSWRPIQPWMAKLRHCICPRSLNLWGLPLHESLVAYRWAVISNIRIRSHWEKRWKVGEKFSSPLRISEVCTINQDPTCPTVFERPVNQIFEVCCQGKR